MKFKSQHYPVLINIGSIPELLEVKIDDKGITIGASFSLSRVDEILKHEIETSPSKIEKYNYLSKCRHYINMMMDDI